MMNLSRLAVGPSNKQKPSKIKPKVSVEEITDSWQKAFRNLNSIEFSVLTRALIHVGLPADGRVTCRGEFAYQTPRFCAELVVPGPAKNPGTTIKSIYDGNYYYTATLDEGNSRVSRKADGPFDKNPYLGCNPLLQWFGFAIPAEGTVDFATLKDPANWMSLKNEIVSCTEVAQAESVKLSLKIQKRYRDNLQIDTYNVLVDSEAPFLPVSWTMTSSQQKDTRTEFSVVAWQKPDGVDSDLLVPCKMVSSFIDKEKVYHKYETTMSPDSIHLNRPISEELFSISALGPMRMTDVHG